MRRGPAARGRRAAGAAHARPPLLPFSSPSGPDHHRRDSDASFCSSNPSSAATPFGHKITPSSRASMLRYVNSCLSSLGSRIVLKASIPPARDILNALSIFTSDLGFHLQHLEDDLPPLLCFLHCPIKLSKSIIRSPATPLAWPSFLTVLHFLAHLTSIRNHLESAPSPPFAQGDPIVSYILLHYSHFIAGDDDSMKDLAMFRGMFEDSYARIEVLKNEVNKKEASIRELRKAPTPKEKLENERDYFKGNMGKLRAMVESETETNRKLEDSVNLERGKLEAKEREKNRICKDNEELGERITEQKLDVDGAERIRMELGMVERDIEEVKAKRKVLEEKVEELDYLIARKLKEVMELGDQCNEAIGKLKLCNDFQYVLNVEGTSTLEVLGGKYKSILKPATRTLAENAKKSKLEMIDLKIALQQELQQHSANEKDKRECAFALHSKIEDATAHCNTIKEEVADLSSLVESETKRKVTEVEARMQKLDVAEKEASEFQKSTSLKLQEESKASNESIQACAQELLVLIDIISNYKEHMESSISHMQSDMHETVKVVADAYTASVTTSFSATQTEASHLNMKRIRLSLEDV